jgi:hypothetical protein
MNEGWYCFVVESLDKGWFLATEGQSVASLEETIPDSFPYAQGTSPYDAIARLCKVLDKEVSE